MLEIVKHDTATPQQVVTFENSCGYLRNVDEISKVDLKNQKDNSIPSSHE